MWDRSQLVGLGIPLRSIAKPSYSGHCTSTHVGGKAGRVDDRIQYKTTKTFPLNSIDNFKGQPVCRQARARLNAVFKIQFLQVDKFSVSLDN
jgi:hypothetical protein